MTNLIKESLSNKWVYKFPMPDWFKKVEFLTNMAVVKNNIIWIKKNDELLLYVLKKTCKKSSNLIMKLLIKMILIWFMLLGLTQGAD